MEEVKLKAEKQAKDDKLMETSSSEIHKSESLEKNIKDKASTSSSAHQDLDSFLLGDLGDSDDGPGNFTENIKMLLFIIFH